MFNILKNKKQTPQLDLSMKDTTQTNTHSLLCDEEHYEYQPSNNPTGWGTPITTIL